MTTITTRATYINGILKPATKLDLPDGATVEVQVTTLPVVTPDTSEGFGSLYGILNLSPAELDDIEHDIARIRRESSERIERLARELDDASGGRDA